MEYNWHDHYVVNLKAKINQYDKDSIKEKRLSVQYCKYCFYIDSSGAFQAFTEFACKNCNKSIMHPNSNVDKYCMDCAKKLDVCVHCGAVMD
jgi:hypothetical protein